MNKYIISVLIGATLTFFILDYIKLRNLCHNNSVWLCSTRQDVSTLKHDIWGEDEICIVKRIRVLEK